MNNVLSRSFTVLSLILGVFAVFGCHRTPPTSRIAPLDPGTPPPYPAGGPQGYFAGTVTIGSMPLYGEALLTADGLIRILIVGSDNIWLPGGENFSQFKGELVADQDQPQGSGSIVGQGCTYVPTSRFCGKSTSARIDISDWSFAFLVGEILVDADEGPEVWGIDMSRPTSTYNKAATFRFSEGLYEETFAEFAHDSDTVISVDAAGLLFFQSAISGCSANGSLTPHLDGRFNVYDAAITISNCDEIHRYLDGDFEGLATRSVGDFGDFDWGDWLVIWLTTPDDAPNVAAITMWGSRI